MFDSILKAILELIKKHGLTSGVMIAGMVFFGYLHFTTLNKLEVNMQEVLVEMEASQKRCNDENRICREQFFQIILNQSDRIGQLSKQIDKQELKDMGYKKINTGDTITYLGAIR